jgi:hypothetical protein
MLSLFGAISIATSKDADCRKPTCVILRRWLHKPHTSHRTAACALTFAIFNTGHTLYTHCYQFAVYRFSNFNVLLFLNAFYSGLHDLRIPASRVELHLLCKLLARDDPELIEYNRIARGLAFVRYVSFLYA